MNLHRLKKDEIIRLITTRCKHRHTLLEHPQCDKKKPEKIGFFDIEASNLDADFGILLSYCIKEMDGKVIGRVITPKELASRNPDKTILKECVKDIRGFDRIVSYYGTRFDVPYIRTRAMLYDLNFPGFQEVKHTDVYYWAKTKLSLHRKRLETVCDFLGIPAKGHRMEPGIWTAALTGNKKALNYILIHNKEDVVSLEKVYKRLLEYTANRANSI